MTGPEEATAEASPDHTTVVSVVVADDHPMWRDAVARDLTDAGFNVVATADDGPSAVNRTLATRPDVLVLDLNLPGLPGDQVCAAIVRAQIRTRVLILSASAAQRDVLEAVKAGATGYLLKSAGREELLEAVRATAGGKAVFTAGLAGLVLGEFRRLAVEPRHTDGRKVPELTGRCSSSWRPVCPTSRSVRTCSSRTAPCRTTSRTPSTNFSCTTASNWSASSSPRAWTLRPDKPFARGNAKDRRRAEPSARERSTRPARCAGFGGRVPHGPE